MLDFIFCLSEIPIHRSRFPTEATPEPTEITHEPGRVNPATHGRLRARMESDNPMRIVCAWCGKNSERSAGHVNRSRAAGLYLYCDRACAALASRKHKTKAQKVEEKRLYDIEYRARNLEALKAKKREYFKRTYDPEEAARYRKARMHKHIEYCRNPEYKAKKHQYDRVRRSKEWGEFGEAQMLLVDLEKEINSRMSRYDIYTLNGTLNKSLQRRRFYENAIGL